ncbi:MAG: PEP-CTERM sorting domain-containing protein [Phycisphaerae bacterium]
MQKLFTLVTVLAVAGAASAGVWISEDYETGTAASYDETADTKDATNPSTLAIVDTPAMGNLWAAQVGNGATWGIYRPDLDGGTGGYYTGGGWNWGPGGAGQWSDGGAYENFTPPTDDEILFVKFAAGFETGSSSPENNNAAVFITKDGVTGWELHIAAETDGSDGLFRVRSREGRDSDNVYDGGTGSHPDDPETDPAGTNVQFGGAYSLDTVRTMTAVFRETEQNGSVASEVEAMGDGTGWNTAVEQVYDGIDGEYVTTGFADVITQVKMQTGDTAQTGGFQNLIVGTTSRADYDLDFDTDTDDASVLIGKWLSDDAVFAEGDSDNDGDVDSDDASTLLADWPGAAQAAEGTADFTLDLEQGRILVDANNVAFVQIKSATGDNTLTGYTPIGDSTIVEINPDKVGEFTLSNTIQGEGEATFSGEYDVLQCFYQLMSEDKILAAEFTVPEPATMMLLGWGGLALLRRRRK